MSSEKYLQLENLPRHIAIIMDGNGRWAQEKNLPRIEGHRKGSDTVEAIVEASREIGIENLTLYAFSQENWYRPQAEVNALMQLLNHFLLSKKQKLLDNDIRLLAIGQIDSLPEEVQRTLTRTIDETKHCSSMTLTLALSYSSRGEILDAVNFAIRQAMSQNDPALLIDEKSFDRLLYTDGRVPPDLLIRTSGEYRISNFLLWQLAYAELYFTDKLWPDFEKDDLLIAIQEYYRRERRFGRTREQVLATC